MGSKPAPYMEIAAAIRSEIARREMAPHTRLPSEPELVRRHGVARATVRRALARLQEEGLIYSRQAVGSFVAEPRVEQDLDRLFSFSEFMVYRGLKAGSRVLTAQMQRITDQESPVLRHLGLAPGSRVVFLRRLRTGSGEPLVIANTWLPAARFRGFLQHDLEREPVYDIMNLYGWKPTDAIQTIQATTLEPEAAELLTAPAGAAALLITRIGYARGVAVEFATDYYRGDRTTFRVRLGVLEKRVSDGVPEDHLAG